MYLPRQLKGQGHAVAVGAAGRGHHRSGISVFRPGHRPDGHPAPPGGHRPLRLPEHPAGGGQHPGLPPLCRVLFNFETAVLRMG